MQTGKFSVRLRGVAVAGLSTGVACATNPVSGRKEVSIVTPAQELDIGSQVYGPVTEEYGLYGDAALSAYVN